MNIEKRYINFSGWFQWQPKIVTCTIEETALGFRIHCTPLSKKSPEWKKGMKQIYNERTFQSRPTYRISLPWGVGSILFYSEFAWLFWNGQFCIKILTKETKTNWDRY
jgi:hypothetical protein